MEALKAFILQDPKMLTDCPSPHGEVPRILEGCCLIFRMCQLNLGPRPPGPVLVS